MFEAIDYLKKQIISNPVFTYVCTILSQLFPISPVQVYAVGFLILVDTITGIAAAHARGDFISSRAARRLTARKVFGHLALVLSSAATVPLLPANTTVILQGVLGMIGAWEMLSIAENLKDMGILKEGMPLVSFLRSQLPKEPAPEVTPAQPEVSPEQPNQEK